MKLELGGSKREGFVTVNLKNSDIIHDLNIFPYPFKNDSIDSLYCFHCLEHLNNPLRVMQEIYRICKHSTTVFIKIPHYSNHSVLKNPEHKHDFHPDWFRSLDSSTKKGKSVYQNMEHLRKCNFRILYIKNTNVWWNPFIKIETQILMMVKKKAGCYSRD